MRQTLEDIRQKLGDRAYKNEEHVRLSLVSRLLLEMGWDTWNPGEVNTEFNAIPNEDYTRVDIALFLTPYSPSAFIEVKAPGKLQGDISQYETQLRDYNRNNTAVFTIITDGQRWRFYYSQTGGEFSKKCFETLDLLTDDIDELERSFQSFLSKSEISSGNAKHNAESYLQLSQKQRAMEDILPHARKTILEPPYPSLPQAIVDLVSRAGITVNLDEAAQFIQEIGARKPMLEPTPAGPRATVRRTTPTESGVSDTLAEIIEVCHEVFDNGLDFTDAAKVVAARRQLKSVATVADKCTRQLELNTAQFRDLLKNKARLISHLVRHFPENRNFIQSNLR
jgi:hypothetical protein